jgi:hypothetical protein
VSAYWRQQVGYGEGETWLDAHHPEKFVRGQMLWRGHIYSPLPFLRSLRGRRVNTGVWGTAAFPSIYSEDSYRLEYLPHSPMWMGVSTAFLLAGCLDLVISTPDIRLLLVGLIGWLTTIVRCVQFARASDLRGLPDLDGRFSGRSRLAYQALIAWLHLVHPIARLWGRIRGLASMPQAVAPEHVSRRTWKAPWPRLHDAVRAARLWLGRSDERAFWSETWVPHTHVLGELVGEARAARPASLVDVDEGWRPDRDFSVAVGRWGWLHVQALVEEHPRGTCLLRVGTRLRLSVLGTLQVLTMAVAITGASIALMSVHWRSGSALALGALALVTARTAWQTARTAALFDRTLLRVVEAAGLVPLAAGRPSANEGAPAATPDAQEGYHAARGV